MIDMRAHSLFVLLFSLLLLLTSVLDAQGTLPKGMHNVEGNTSSWDSFETGSLYNPCKAVYTYDATSFPWDHTRSHVIHTLSFRRDGPYSLKGQTRTAAATKKWTLWLSAHSKASAAHVDVNHFERSHGLAKTLVYGALGRGKDVILPATSRPVGGPAAFNVTVRLDKQFVVPANSSCLVLEVRSYDETITSSGWWRADGVRYSTAGWSPGSFTTLNSTQCVSPSITHELHRSTVIGASMCRVYRTMQAPGNKLMLSWLGPRMNPAIRVPGTSCDLHVAPSLMLASVTGTSGTYTGVMDFGPIPRDLRFVGIDVHHQSAFLDTRYPGGLGLSQGAVTRVGSGFDPKLVQGLTIFSYGVNTAHEHGTGTRSRVVMPDAETYSKFAVTRHPIVKIN